MTIRKHMFTQVTQASARAIGCTFASTSARILICALAIAFAMTGAANASTLAADSAQVEAARHLALGNTLYEQGQFEKAVAEYTEAARLGNAEAQFDLGYAYYNGEGAEKDYAKAARWFKRSASQRFAKAEFNLAYCYMNGRGVPRDYDKALIYLTKAAAGGFQMAQMTLADCYAGGILVEQNAEESKMWREMAEGKTTAPQAEQPAEPKAKAPVQKPDAPAVKQPETPAVGEDGILAEGVSPQDMLFDIDLGGDKPLVERKKPTPATPKADTPKAVNPDVTRNDHVAKDSVAAPRPAIVLTKDGIVKPREDVAAAPAKDSTLAMADTTRHAPTVAETDAKKAPVVRILYPEDQSLFHTDNVKVKYQLLTYGYQGPTQVNVLVDGVKQPDSRAVKQANTVEVDLPNRDCTVMLYAQNANGNSEPVSIRLIRENVAQVDLPKLFVVAVGVGKYDNEKLPNLKLTCKDAQDFANVAAKKKGQPFSDVQVKVLCDEEATRSDLFEAMEWMAQEASPNDLCIFFFAGHGYRDEKDRFYFMPYHGRIDQLYDCFSATDFKNAADDINSKLVIFVDACYSGGLLSGQRSAAATHFIEQLRRTKNGMLLYASSASDTKSNEDPTWGNGAFTKALIEAFNGAAKQATDEGLSTQQLEMYLYKEVRKTTNFKQSPVFMNPNGMEHFNIFTYEN